MNEVMEGQAMEEDDVMQAEHDISVENEDLEQEDALTLMDIEHTYE